MPETPEPPAAPPAPGGISNLLSQLDAAAEIDKGKAPAPAPEPPKEPAAPKPVEPPKPAAVAPTVKKDPAKPDPAAPTADPNAEPDWEKAPQKWHNIYKDHKAKTGATIKTLEAKIAEIEAKAKEAPADAGRIAALEKQIADLGGEAKTYKQKLAERDYYSSEEYQKTFLEPAKQHYVSAVRKMLLYPAIGDDGNPRASVQKDFDDLRALAAGPIRDEAAKDLFGDTVGPKIAAAADQLDDINEKARLAAEDHGQKYEQTAAQRAAAEAESQKKGKETFQQHYKAALTAIQDNPNYGKWFKPDESDPELAKMLQEGYDEIEAMGPKVASLSIEDQAAHAAVYRARSAATPVLITAINRLQTKYDAVVAELEALRGNDPGKLSGKSGAPADPAKPGGIASLAAAFDNQ